MWNVCNQIFIYLYAIIKQIQFKQKFKKSFPESHMQLGNIFNLNSISIGKHSYGPINYYNNPTQPKHGNIKTASNDKSLIIGNYVSIANGVKFFSCMDHRLHGLSTFPFKKLVMHTNDEIVKSKGPIIVGDDVWISDSALILCKCR